MSYTEVSRDGYQELMHYLNARAPGAEVAGRIRAFLALVPGDNPILIDEQEVSGTADDLSERSDVSLAQVAATIGSLVEPDSTG